MLNTSIVKVVYSGPATIVFWDDNTKTVVKCQEGDSIDDEKGLAMAIAKKALGNKGNYYDDIRFFTNLNNARKIRNSDALVIKKRPEKDTWNSWVEKLAETFKADTVTDDTIAKYCVNDVIATGLAFNKLDTGNWREKCFELQKIALALLDNNLPPISRFDDEECYDYVCK